MARINIGLRNGRSIPFDVDLGLTGNAYFVFGVRKSGSTLLNRLASRMARLNGRRFVNVGDIFFTQNVLASRWQFDPALQELIHPENVFGGFREMPFSLLESDLFVRSPKILIVRDPRDALVSEYFSNAYSHPIPEQTAEHSDTKALMERQRQEALRDGADKFVIDRARGMARTITQFAQIVKAPRTLLVKYEECIFKKRELIGTMLRHFGWTLEESAIAEILSWADVRPEKEDPHAFIRKVTPGDHREKLRPDTIATLNGLLAEAMTFLDYPTDP